jgi:hypothetical protein
MNNPLLSYCLTLLPFVLGAQGAKPPVRPQKRADQHRLYPANWGPSALLSKIDGILPVRTGFSLVGTGSRSQPGVEVPPTRAAADWARQMLSKTPGQAATPLWSAFSRQT